MNLPVLIVGGGGHAKVLVEALHLRSVTILGITDIDPARFGTDVLGVRVIGNDDAAEAYTPESLRLVNGIGSVRMPEARAAMFEKFKRRGFTFTTVIHPSAVIAADVALGEGVQVMAGAVIQTGSRIGMNSIINTNASVDHDCIIGDHVHLSPGVTVSGGVRIDDVVHIGAGATVIQGVKIGKNSMVGAGSVVVHDVPDGAEFFGVPARKRDK